MTTRLRTLAPLLAMLAAGLLLAACGGGGADKPSGATPPEATEVGRPIGAQASAVIGRDGGTLRSADGQLVVEVPAGAFSRDETVTLQEISNEAHGAPGRAWRVGPADLTPALPVTLRFGYDTADLDGTDAAEFRAAYQDAQRRWVVPSAPQLDTAERTVTVRTRRFADWSRFARTSLSPTAATLKVGQQLALKVVRCEVVGFEAGADGEDPQLVRDCQPAPKVKTLGPQVNGQSGGNATVGTVVRPDAERAEYLYTAPGSVPNPRTVAVSVETLLAGAPGSNARTFLISHITIEEEGEGCAWVRSTEAFEYDVLLGAFEVRAAQGNARYSGTGKLSAQGRMVRATSPAVPVIVFSSYGQPAQGLVNVHGTLQVNDPAAPYTQTYSASSGPSGGSLGLSPTAFVLVVDTRDCSYTFGGGAMTTGMIAGGPEATDDAVLAPGALHYKGMPIATAAAATRTIEVTGLEAPFALDTDGVNGFAPWTSLRSLPFEAGSTLVTWTLRAAAQ